ncbi:hypothetical protein Tco_0238767, partial [Tanacetum coccineum]
MQRRPGFKQNSFYSSNSKGVKYKGGNGVNQNKSQLKARSNVDVSNKKIQGNGSKGNSFNSTSKGAGNVLKKPANAVYVAKSLQQLSKDPNYKPKVLVRGSSSKDVADAVSMEPIAVNNSFQALIDDDMDQGSKEDDINVQEEFDSNVWPGLKEEVVILMEAGIYPSKAV